MASIAKQVDKAFETMEFADLVGAPVDALQGVSAADAEMLRKALNITSIGDLARNKYFLAAQAIATLAGKA